MLIVGAQEDKLALSSDDAFFILFELTFATSKI